MHTRNITFLFLNRNICCGYSKEPSRYAKIYRQENIYNYTLNIFVHLNQCYSEIDNLLGQLEDLKFQNGKFVEEITKLHQQLETQEENVMTVAGEIQTKQQEGEQLKKRVKR